MASEVKLPRLGQGMESGTIVKWLKSEGDQVEKGEPLYELDTDKVTQEVEAEASGVLLEIAVAEGEVPRRPDDRGHRRGGRAGVPSRAATAASAAQEVDEDPQEEGSPGTAREQERERGREAGREQIAEARQPAGHERRRAGQGLAARPPDRPRARDRALGRSTGTGPEGRIVAEDVERAGVSGARRRDRARAAAPGEIERVELTTLRKTIARRLTEAWQSPVFQLADLGRHDPRATRSSRACASTRRDPKATVTDVLTKVCAAALMRHREVNAQYADDAILLLPSANIGIAVAIAAGPRRPGDPRRRAAALAEIAAARADIVSRAREGKLRRDDLDGGTFTISNLGMFGVERFIAVLNPPQAAILAVGATEEQAGRGRRRARRAAADDHDRRPATTARVDGATGGGVPPGRSRSFLEEPGLML